MLHQYILNASVIADRKQEMEDVKGDYQMDIDRFEQLLDVVELRRTLLANENR